MDGRPGRRRRKGDAADVGTCCWRQVEVPAMVVYLNKVDMMEDDLFVGLVELVALLLSSYNFPGDDMPIVRGSSCGVESTSKDYDAPEYASIRELMRVVDEYIPTPVRETEKPFLMPVEDVFGIKGRGTVVTGRIERGKVKVGETIEIVGLRETRSTVVTGVEMFRKILQEGLAGDNVGCLLRASSGRRGAGRCWRRRSRSRRTRSSSRKCTF